MRKWQDVEYRVAPATAPLLLAVTRTLESVYVNGGVILRLYRPIDDKSFDDAERWDLQGLEHTLRCFLEAPSVQRAVPELRIPVSLSPMPGFTVYNGFEFEGAVTHLLLKPAAYRESGLDEETARHMSRAFVDVLAGVRRPFATVWKTEKPWTDWFHGVVWDATFVIQDKQARQWAIFAVTDTD